MGLSKPHLHGNHKDRYHQLVWYVLPCTQFLCCFPAQRYKRRDSRCRRRLGVLRPLGTLRISRRGGRSGGRSGVVSLGLLHRVYGIKAGQ